MLAVLSFFFGALPAFIGLFCLIGKVIPSFVFAWLIFLFLTLLLEIYDRI